MKTLKLFTLIAFVFASYVSFAGGNLPTSEEGDRISSMSREVAIDVTKDKGVVTLEILFKHPENIQEMVIERGTLLGESFRQVKSLTKADLQKVKEGKLTVEDKFPLPGTDGVYYRAVAVDNEGIIRFFPASQIKIGNNN